MATQEARREALDQYIAEGGKLNDYGDREDIMYMGGSPLFNESTGESISKEAYHLQVYGRSLEDTLAIVAQHQ
ncbi:unnamed protein product [Moneuplotes crassus]|uniref:Uncharacterized protein n=1 Tax=Euplotes crassus TaxID=5936 RepID=A0AAD1Y872_EUPCR|nr:unnamed protein product [Moneuplotes crassus]